MYYYSKGEYRRSANHFTFIEDQLDHLAFSKPYLALQIRYNIGKVYMQLLNPDRASSEFIECKLLLPRIDSLKMLQLKDKIDNEIYNLQVQRIEEVSFQFESSRNSAELQDITPFT